MTNLNVHHIKNIPCYKFNSSRWKNINKEKVGVADQNAYLEETQNRGEDKHSC